MSKTLEGLEKMPQKSRDGLPSHSTDSSQLHYCPSFSSRPESHATVH
jgi:hypothetical protein